MSTVITGPVYVVKDNIDTDQIIPAQFLNLVPTIPEEYEKLGSYALCGLPESGYPKRYVAEGELDSRYPIVVGGRNFGCGSSREHAPWALLDWGFRVIIAPTFADIFYNNCFNNSILPIRLPQEQVDKLMADANQASTIKVSVEEQTIERPNGEIIRFELDAGLKRRLLEGLDPVGMTLEHEGDISAFENDDRGDRPWAHMAA